MSSVELMKWAESPWFSRQDDGPGFIRLGDRLLQSASEPSDSSEYLEKFLPEIAAEFSARWAAVICRTPEWKTSVQFGRHSIRDLPYRFLEDCLDREAAGHTACDDPSNWSVVAVPLGPGNQGQRLLVLAGTAFSESSVPWAVGVGRALTHCLSIIDKTADDARRIDRLRSTLDIASSFANMRETEPLLELIANEATRLLECDRASIFIWDKDRSEVVACPALGVEGNTLRLPDNKGVVGEVIHSSKSARVDNCYEDARFNKDVDELSGYTSRNLLCFPLVDGEGELIGAFEVINKNEGPFTEDDEESLTQLGVQAAIAILNTREREQLIRSREQLAEHVTQGVQIIGESPAIVALRGTIQRLAETDLPVLILGESGTGKEVVAQSLHFRGSRAANPFIAVNCAALSETLLESELFGHEKGSFTDAHETRAGKFELAEGGTLFLDEIGDMSVGGQAKLLRVLEQKVITRVGGSQTIPIDVRILAATNANLVQSVQEKKFREDLYFRLSVVTQQLAPLRERPEDILPLAEHFLRPFCVQARRPALKLSAEARRRLQAHSWPGNVRELRNLMERVAFLTAGEKVEADDLAFILSPEREAGGEPSLDIGLGEATKQFQQEYIRRCIKRVKGNMSEAARLMGLHRSNLYRKMRQLDMQEGEFE